MLGMVCYSLTSLLLLLVARAGYHSAALYHALRGAVQPLTELLTDDEYKTRANAAGALGNLVRNSGMLCTPIVQARALQASPCCCCSAAA